MKQVTLELPTLMFIIGTRAVLGAGVALLVSAGHSEQRRKRVGRVLVAIGAVTTAPALLAIVRGIGRGRGTSAIGRSSALAGAARFARKADDDVMPPEWDATDLDEAEDIDAASRE